MGFERCHPAVNLIYFTAVIAGTICFHHPVYLAISLMGAFIYSVKRNGRRGLGMNLRLILLILLFTLYYSTFHHFGVTVLGRNRIGNPITLEAMVYGLVIGCGLAGVWMWLSCVYSVFSSDKTVYLFGRISPRLSLFASILLRMGPRIKREAGRIHTARRGIGRGAGQGNMLARMKNVLAIASALITWTLETLLQESESMRSRGSLLRGRSAFSIYRFDHRDRICVIVLFGCLTLTLMSALLGQTDMQYDPRIIMAPVTPMSWLFYGGYAFLCLMSTGMEAWTEYRFRKSRARS